MLRSFVVFCHFRDGDCEYTEVYVRRIKMPNDLSDDEIKDKIIVDLGYEPYDFADECGHWMLCGSREFSISWKEIKTEEHLKILREYLS